MRTINMVALLVAVVPCYCWHATYYRVAAACCGGLLLLLMMLLLAAAAGNLDHHAMPPGRLSED